MGAPAWPTDLRKRLRAARGYAGMSLDDLAQKTGLGRQTIFRMESGERGPERVKEMELREIARVCGLPYGFFTADLDGLEETPQGVTERLDDMAEQLDAIAAALAVPTDGEEPDALPEPGSGHTRANGKSQAGG